jgi:multidrug efflux pump subunit AcrA (membrane-fusion protein)
MKINFRSRFVIGAGVIILLLVMIGRGCSGRRVAGRAYRVEKKDIGRSFLERGQLMSLNTVPIELRASGEILELLSSGTSVTKGDVVALIDNRQSVENLENMEFDILVSKFEEEILKAERQLVDLRERNRIELLARQLEFAELEEKMAREGLTPEERRLLLIERGYAWIKHEDVCDELERQKRLFTRGYVPQSIIDRYEREAVIAKAYLDEKDAQIRIKEKVFPRNVCLNWRRKLCESVSSRIAVSRPGNVPLTMLTAGWRLRWRAGLRSSAGRKWFEKRQRVPNVWRLWTASWR